MARSKTDIDSVPNVADLDALKLTFGSVSDEACALLGYQRTKQISRRSRLSWEAGDPGVLRDEVKSRKDDIILGAFLEIYREYLPLKALLGKSSIKSVCDIGCGQGVNDLFLLRDFAPKFTLIDIEETDQQYHLWAKDGSGYASLSSAKALLVENGAKATDVKTINPTKKNWDQKSQKFDLVTSLYSCGFHYPVDEYLDLFLGTIDAGGAVCLDLRKRYLKQGSDGASLLMAAAEPELVYDDQKSFRYLFRKQRKKRQ